MKKDLENAYKLIKNVFKEYDEGSFTDDDMRSFLDKYDVPSVAALKKELKYLEKMLGIEKEKTKEKEKKTISRPKTEWQRLVSAVKKDNPQLSFKEVLQVAKKLYNQ